MEKCGCAEYLCDRAEAPVFIFVAYFSALLPLAVVYTLDFITEKWKSISATRREGRWHLFASVFCLPYLLYFIHLQRCIGNYTEVGAAITAIFLSCFQMARTVWGLVQLEAFKCWNVHALYTMTRIGYPVRSGAYVVAVDNRRPRFSLDDIELNLAVEMNMVVNSTLIDNAFFGTEIPIRWHVPSCRLYSTAPVECSVRWMVSFLSRFGST